MHPEKGVPLEKTVCQRTLVHVANSRDIVRTVFPNLDRHLLKTTDYTDHKRATIQPQMVFIVWRNTMRTFVVIALLVACAVTAFTQEVSSQTRAQTLAAAFNKHKQAVKEKYGVRMDKYKDVRSEPLVRQNIADYSGVYELSDLGFVINVQVGSDGKVQANGYDKTRTFTLENARIEGALLTASKVYQDGAKEKFEGVFLSRTDRNSPTDPGVTMLGLGVIPTSPIEAHGLTYDKLFYQFKQ
jgi:hypothetical protein